MSVAFRREGDEEHLEPKFELPIPAGPNRVTARGLALIEARLAALDARLAEAEDEEARKKLLRERRYWLTRHATAELMPPPRGAVVEFGSMVTYRLGGKTATVTLVGDDEADPAHGLIAAGAPLARAMMGAEPGERADFNGREEALEIVAIGLPPA